MPLSDQETRNIKIACDALSRKFGGGWVIQRMLDEEISDRPSPEVVVGNGKMTAAIEVKELIGDEIFQRYREYQFSNERSLAGSVKGYFSLGPPPGTSFDIPSGLRRHIRTEIERVGPTLREGDEGAINVPRQGNVSCAPRESTYIHCCHHGPISPFWDPIREVVSGYVFLVDCDGPNGTSGPDHSLHTEEGKRAFYDALLRAIARYQEGDSSRFTWNEEWLLFKHDDEGEPGVWPLLVDDARAIRPSLAAAIQTLITKAEQKFTEEWADRNLFVLDSTALGPDGLIQELVREECSRMVKSPIHSVLLVEGERLSAELQLSG